MKNFKHFVITRFNLNLYPRDKHQSPTRTEKWLSNRFEIFERYCLPSMKAQTTDQYTWICLFDSQTPEEYRNRIEGYRNECPAFTPIYYNAEQTERLTESLRHTLSACHPHKGKGRTCLLITTNLDNDDALACDTVALLQQEILRQGFGPQPASSDRPRTIYSLLYGYQYFTDQKFALKMRYTNNHFLTLAEPFDDRAETIISFRHTKATRQLPTIYLDTPHGKWLEFVHKDNVSNDFRINSKVVNIPVLYSRSFRDFGLPLRTTWWSQWFKTLTLLPAQFVVTAYTRLKRKIHK